MEELTSQVVNALKKNKNVIAIILFGSHAKNNAKPSSDIDIAVIAEKPSKKLDAEIAGLCSKILDVVSFHRLPLYIKFEVFKYGKPLFIKPSGDNALTGVKFKLLRDYHEMEPSYEKFVKAIMA